MRILNGFFNSKSSVKCPKCGGELEVVKPPIVIFLTDKECFIAIKCKNCDFKWWSEISIKEFGKRFGYIPKVRR